MTTTTKKTVNASEVKKAIVEGRTANADGLKKKLTAIARGLGMKYNTEFVPYCEKNMVAVFKELGEELPKALGAKEGTKRNMTDKIKAVAPKLLVQTIIEADGKLTAKQIADKLNMRANSFQKQYDELKAKGVKLPALPDGNLAESDIEELNAMLMDADAK